MFIYFYTCNVYHKNVQSPGSGLAQILQFKKCYVPVVYLVKFKLIVAA